MFDYYEDLDIQRRARLCIPINELNHSAQKMYEAISSGKLVPVIQPKPMSLEDCSLLELMFWFKNEFFKWFHVPDCSSCGRTLTSVGMDVARPEELIWGAGRVENYRCGSCNSEVRFPRYNHPLKLLETRIGRCGEWANCFTLCCCAMGFEVRYVLDWTDHVWSEVFSHSQGRWLHCDPCENVCDSPLLYEVGWGKKLAYVLAFSKDDVQDVTWRYSCDHNALLQRRLLCRETWLLAKIMHIREKLRQGITAERKKVLDERVIKELVEFMSPRKVKDSDTVGRQSGDLNWRIQRGEVGTDTSCQRIAFEPSVEEIASKVFHVKYCTAADKYMRVSTLNTEIDGWKAGVWEMQNIFRKTEMDWKMVYLSRTEGAPTGTLSWKFDCSKTSLNINSVTVTFPFCVYENGNVLIQLRSGDECIQIPGGERFIFE